MRILRPMRQRNQTLGLRIWQRLDQHAVDHAENRAGRSDPHREHKDRGQRESRKAAQLAHSVSEHGRAYPGHKCPCACTKKAKPPSRSCCRNRERRVGRRPPHSTLFGLGTRVPAFEHAFLDS